MAFGNGFSVGSVMTVFGVVGMVVLSVEDKTGSVEVVTSNDPVELSGFISSISGFPTTAIMPKMTAP